MQQQNLMNYEWTRLSTFKSFPKSSNVSSIRLAQSGFYYSGNGTEAICFCCRLKNELWDTNETVHAIHTRLSPNCKFVKGEETNNVAIHGVSKVKEVKATGVSFINEPRYPTEGATGGPENVQTENEPHYRNEFTSTSEVGSLSLQDVESTALISTSPQESSGQSSYHTERNSKRTSDLAINRNLGSINRFPGVINEQPKHPDYATRGARLTSFTGWPSNTVQPEALTSAGFFYAGIKDCVRCFFCGSGLQNWEQGDNPWTEHARWFPNCTYVKQCKGVNIVEMCPGTKTKKSTTSGAKVSEVPNSPETTIVENLLIEDLNSSAAVNVLEMGYTQTQVEDAIKKARQIHGNTEIKAQNLLEFLLENDFTATVSSSPTCNLGQTPANTDIPVAKPNAKKKKIDEQRTLREENQKLKEQMLCKICMDKDANTVFLPCGHMVSCIECAHALRKCAICRRIIEGTVRTYPS